MEPAASPDRLALPELGERIRTRRAERGLSVREIARRLNVSPSLISQIERGKATPSVGTLYAITTELGLSLDALFAGSDDGDATASAAVPSAAAALSAKDVPDGLRVLGALGGLAGDGEVVHPEDRAAIELSSGVRWERMTTHADPNVDFLYVVYEPGGASCDASALMRHSGREYGHVLSGTLEVTIGFEKRTLEAGDAISFDSTIPHRLATVGDEPVEALWFVVGRNGDARVPSST